MKKILLTILLFTASTLIYSQSMDLNHKKIHIVDSTMGLGITPTSRLHVFGNGTASNLFNVTNDKDATKDSSVVIDAIGNVGIGKEIPTAKLYVQDTTSSIGGSIPVAYIRAAKPNKIALGAVSISIVNEVIPDYNIGLYASSMGGTNNFAGYFNKGDVYIDNNLGIGRLVPTYRLDVFGNGGANNLLKVSNDINSTYDSTFVIKSNGFVGIGTTTPAAALHIKGAEQIGNINTLIADSVNAIRLSGTATVWEVLTFPFSTGHQVNANYPPFNADSLYFEFSIDSTGSDAQIMYFIVQMPHSWKEGSTIYPHVHYKYEDAVGACSFRMKYKWFNIGSTTAVGWKWANMNITSGANDKNHAFVRTYSGINGSGKTISSILICKVYLYGISGTGTCKAYQFDIHYEKDALGSNTEKQKN